MEQLSVNLYFINEIQPREVSEAFQEGHPFVRKQLPGKQEKDQEIESNCMNQEPNESPWPIRNHCLIYLEGDIEIQSSSTPGRCVNED